MIHAGSAQASSNIVKTVEKLDVDGDGKFTWLEFRTLHETFPQVLFPCFRLQISIVRNIMGVKWWKKKKEFLLLEMVRALPLSPRCACYSACAPPVPAPVWIVASAPPEPLSLVIDGGGGEERARQA